MASPYLPTRLPKECGRHCTQGSNPQPHSGDFKPPRTDLPSRRSPTPFIPKGFQPIAGGERSVTTGSRPPEPPYPEGIAALRVVDSRASAGIPSGYGSLWMLETGGVRCARPPAMGCDPCGVEEWARIPGDSASDGDHTPSKSRKTSEVFWYAKSGRSLKRTNGQPVGPLDSSGPMTRAFSPGSENDRPFGPEETPFFGFLQGFAPWKPWAFGVQRSPGHRKLSQHAQISDVSRTGH